MGRSLSLATLALLVGCGAPSRGPAAEHAPSITVSPADAAAAVQDLAQHVEPSLGLVVVEDVARGDGETRPTRRATFRCASEIATLNADLLLVLAQRPADAPGWSCAGADCELPGAAEYDPTRIVRFGRGREGQTVVRGYFALDTLAVDPDTVAHTRLNADRDFDELTSHRCP